MMEQAYDVIILGAGPAGCAAAIRARQAGLRVLVLDQNPAPKLSPGETLHPGIEPLFHQLGVLDAVLNAGFLRHRGIWLKHAEQSTFMPYGEDAQGPWLGFQADRLVLNAIFQQAVLDSEASLMRNIKLESVLWQDDRVIGVQVNGAALYATWTIDATGRQAWLANQLGLANHTYSPTMKATFGWQALRLEEADGEPTIAFNEVGWDWLAPLADGRRAWVKLRIAEPASLVSPGMDFTWRLRARPAGPGYFVIGDAAAVLDPSSSHGVLRALMSGIFVAHLIEGWFSLNMAESLVHEAYVAWITEHFEQDVSRMRQLYEASPAKQYFLNYGHS